jgi:hypothetical protein
MSQVSLFSDGRRSFLLQHLVDCVPTLAVVDMSWYGMTMIYRLVIADPASKTFLSDGFNSRTFLEDRSWSLRDQSFDAIVETRSKGERVLVCCSSST